MMQPISLFGNLFEISVPGSLFFFLSLQKLAVWLLRDETVNKFVLAEACIAVEIYSADDRHHVFVAGQASVLSQE